MQFLMPIILKLSLHKKKIGILYCFYLFPFLSPSQMQEIGDMQQTLNMKQDYRKMQRALQHKTKQCQDAVCEKLELQKQVRMSKMLEPS